MRETRCSAFMTKYWGFLKDSPLLLSSLKCIPKPGICREICARAHTHTHTHMLPQIYHRRCQERYGAVICSFQLFSFFFFSLFYHFHVLERIIKLIYLRIRVFVHSGKIQSWKSRLLSNIKHFYLLCDLSFTVHRLSECRVRMASSSAWVSGAASIKEQQPTLELNITIMK